MFAKVTFNFNGNQTNYRGYGFITDIKNFKTGDIVVVEGEKDNTTAIAVFAEYCESTDLTIEPTKRILKKVHKSTLKAMIRKRLDVIDKIIIDEKIIKKYRKLINKGYLLNTDKEVLHKIMRQLAIATYSTNENEKEKGIYYLNYGGLRFTIRRTNSEKRVKNVFKAIKKIMDGKVYVKSSLYIEIVDELILQREEKYLSVIQELKENEKNIKDEIIKELGINDNYFELLYKETHEVSK